MLHGTPTCAHRKRAPSSDEDAVSTHFDAGPTTAGQVGKVIRRGLQAARRKSQLAKECMLQGERL
jgi:hypothetical protein